MNLLTLAGRGLVHYASMHAAVLLGVVAGTAVLTGALIVGDSVTGSLRSLTLERLGNIDQALIADRFFRAALAGEVASDKIVPGTFAAVVPAIVLRGTVENPAAGTRANGVNVLGCDEQFAQAGAGGPPLPLAATEAVINEALAGELGVKIGDELLLRIPVSPDVPPDSPWGRKSESVRSRRLQIKAVIPNRGLGQFALRPSQRQSLVAFVSLATLQAALEEPGRVNALFALGNDPQQPAPEAADAQLAAALRPELSDYGLAVEVTKRGYVRLASDRLMIAPAIERTALKQLAPWEPRGVLAYLANSIAAGQGEIPYSTIAAVDYDEQPPWGPLVDPAGEPIGSLADDEIVLNQWAAGDLGGLAPGDVVRITYFEPESTHGEVRERTAEFSLKAVCPMSGAADDPALTPEVRGVTDQESIADWDPPFPFHAERVREQDETYWDEHRGTPKAFVSLATGQRLWGSRFGRLTSLAMPVPDERTPEAADELQGEIARRLQFDSAELGMSFAPIKRQGLIAAQGTTPFAGLFLGFSFFLIAAAVMLVALLFRLGIERRASEVGMLLALGLRAAQVRRLFVLEALVVTVLGGLLGAAAGVGYAWLMLAGLRTWWRDAVNTNALQLTVTPQSLLIGAASGTLVALLAIAWSVWSAGRVSVRRLLAGEMTAPRLGSSRGSFAAAALGAVALVAAVTLAVFSRELTAEQQAGAFFGSGALALFALLAWIWSWLAAGGGALGLGAGGGLLLLAARNAARAAGRSALTIALVAVACFLIVALSAFRIDPAGDVPSRTDGTGGFALVAESDHPLYVNPDDADARADLGFSPQAEQVLAGAKIFPLRVRPGDDASCLNLYQPRQPRVLGVPPDLVQRGGFDWAQTAPPVGPHARDEADNPWRLLERSLPADEHGRPRVPAVIDFNTAMYSMHLWQGVGATFSLDDGQGGTITLEVVGLLQNSILQGDVLIAESQFKRLFPAQSGFRILLVDAPPQDAAAVQQALESNLSDFGVDAQPTLTRLAGFAAVQNTYLSTFQSLGGLGLLLGTLGLATVQLRNVLERRGELALLQAVGFARGRVAELVLWEQVWLLATGLIVGVVAALVAVLPHWLLHRATVPWQSLGLTLAAVVVAGLLASLFAVRAAMSEQLIAALRGD
ncbi:MAG: ABC transporter permease [Pirellulales bacterium]|nr:ABC transporter permease [Pirellulales bacterium]